MSHNITETTSQVPLQHATLGGGCFWCIESAFKQVEGIIDAESGYAGGHVDNPTYQQVCNGNTGHAEVVRLAFDPALISYREILEIFFALHDPTQLNRQGNDIGPQYRSVIFFHDENQQAQAQTIIAQMTQEQTWPAPVVTAVEPLSSYFSAEDYHRDYYQNNPQQPYCAMVVGPKLAKFKQTFAKRLKQPKQASA
ncbi:peptide-methionine (S)-S-oxide reductase MsrA [Aliidiomarina maris]|uniref:Peptide methionine sulfoxide reductase MsrA n=1 Tax=Aliidiomarina maris TaxID=531312 RepID=A0A327X5P3_9GAMM|nr:peptide-methionine (S)-S-oxide reductase MsrA [Aliidiomarina maris]RAK00664.1 peptide-methionine (S)-S-oxide reductase [Aliidiomarina maris]RUO27329.1 peptide-methionine (S)-S-oxide reductase [Aliidiomarina maris]